MSALDTVEPLDAMRRPAGGLRRTSDPDEACLLLREVYSPNRLVVKDVGRLDVRINTIELPDVRVVYFAAGVDLQVIAPQPDCYVACVAVEGSIRIGSRRASRRVDRRNGFLVQPREPALFSDSTPDCVMLTVRFDEAALATMLSDMLARPIAGPVRFAPRLDLSDARSGVLVRSMRMLHDEAVRPDGMVGDHALAHSLSRLLLTSLLRAQPHEYSDELDAPRTLNTPRPIRKAIELIETDPVGVTCVADLGRVANLSVRALEDGFRRHVGTSPMAYLRATRLRRVHDELLASDPSVVTTAAVAQRWGFNHYGRFATAYRAQYGRGPGDTLRGR